MGIHQKVDATNADTLPFLADNGPKAYVGFKKGDWNKEIDVRNFIQNNYTPYEGAAEFLASPTAATIKLWDNVLELMKEENKKGVLDADTEVVSSIVSHAPGYIDKDLEKIIGMQTDAPLKRALMPYGGLKMAAAALESNGYKISDKTTEIFSKHRKTHNDGVFDLYTPEIRRARSAGIVTGLPDAYGRGRIIGDYRRVALYGIVKLMEDKKAQHASLDGNVLNEETLRLREEISEQYRSLAELKEMGTAHGFDIGRPAETAQEAIQWLYLGYLAAIKEQNGAAMSLGRTTTFLDIYIQRDMDKGLITEAEAQELMDHFVMSSAWFASCVLQTTTHCSPAILYGLQNPSAAWALTAAH